MTGAPQIRDGRFLRFEVRRSTMRSTVHVAVISKRSGELEGEIRWYGRRGYSLFPATASVFGPVCLADISRVCRELTDAHRGQQRLEVAA